MRGKIQFALPVFLLLLASCGKENEEIRVYKVSYPEEHRTNAAQAPAQPPPMSGTRPGPPSAMPALPGMAEAAAAVDTPDWTVPAEWENLPPTPIRKGNFRITGGPQPVEITVTVFPDDVGGLQANVNRWRRQVGLPPLAPDEIGSVTRTLQVDGSPATVVDLVSPTGAAAPGILGAVIPQGDQTWFVKAMGPSAVIEEQRPQFESFLQSISF